LDVSLQLNVTVLGTDVYRFTCCGF